MFVNAIEKVAQYTRPIHTISRNYQETFVSPGSATLFFVNDYGCAVTCKHMVDLIANRQAINEKYRKFLSEKSLIGKNNKYIQRIKIIAEFFNYKEDSIIQLKELFVSVTTEPFITYRWINHPKYDLSILIFENFKNPLYQSYAKFLGNSFAGLDFHFLSSQILNMIQTKLILNGQPKENLKHPGSQLKAC